ncbi:hypothetical protein LCGC14_0343440 [marine sediment metagenome]|uniref:Uncharacterized protein n=1 Tax=marine sediment metagenome TaxID=412755 RepID=A0A0F9W0G5_9ZZZZ
MAGKWKYALSCPKCRWTKDCHPLMIDGVLLTDFGKMQCTTCMCVLHCEAKEDRGGD